MNPSLALFQSIGGALLALGVIAVIGWVAITRIRAWMKAPDETEEGFTLSDLRRLHREGSLSDEEFEQWVAKAKSEGKALTRDAYLNLVKPSERNPVERFASVDEGLYDKVLNRCVEDGKMCMHHMMAIDAAGGEAYLKAVGMNLPQDVCTVQNADRVVAFLDQRGTSAEAQQ
jgi:hypothetical protein